MPKIASIEYYNGAIPPIRRPLHARVAKDNIGSLRVLQKCGFTIVGEDNGFANARGAETEAWILSLN